MKKSLFILSLALVASNVFSNAGAGISTSLEIKALDYALSPTDTKLFSISIDGGYTLSGSSTHVGSNYNYTGTLTRLGVVIGTVTGQFQVQVVNGVECIIAYSSYEYYSNDATALVLKTRHTTTANTVRNLR